MNRKYRRYHRYKQPDIFDALIEIFIAISVLLGKLLFKLTRVIFQSRTRPKQSFKLTEASLNTSANTVGAPIMLQTNSESRYTLKQSLLRDDEKEFLEVLKQIVDNKYIIESQVLLSGIVQPIDSTKNYNNYRDFNVIKAKSIDFVLYDKGYKPYLAIELDGSSHLRWDRIKRDQIVDEIMESVGLRIIHIPVSYSYDMEKLKKQIFQRI